MKHKKADELVTITLTLTASEARFLRDEIYCDMGELVPEFPVVSMGGFVSARAFFEEYRQEEYAKPVVPVLEKLYSAVRIALGQSPDVPELHGPYTHRCAKHPTSVEVLLNEYLDDIWCSLRIHMMGAACADEAKRAQEQAAKCIGARLCIGEEVAGQERQVYFELAGEKCRTLAEVKKVIWENFDNWALGQRINEYKPLTKEQQAEEDARQAELEKEAAARKLAIRQAMDDCKSRGLNKTQRQAVKIAVRRAFKQPVESEKAQEQQKEPT